MLSTSARALLALSLGCLLGVGCDQPADTDAGVDAGSNPTDAGPADPDTGTVGTDAGPEADAGPPVDAGPLPDAGPPVDAGPSGGSIQDARAAADTGAVAVAVSGATVTYVRPEVGDEGAGFFLQEAMVGPAIFVHVDPATLTPAAEVGQVVDVTVTEVVTVSGHVEVTALDTGSWSVTSSGGDVSALAQDVSATDLVAMLDAHSAELVSLSGVTIANSFRSCGSPSQCAQITTSTVTEAANSFRFRAPFSVLDELDLREGCVIEIGPTPLWRFNDDAQPSAWRAEDVTVTSCPAAMAPQAGELVFTEIHAASAMADDFLELTSTTDEPLELDGCELRGAGNTVLQTITGATVVLPMQRFVVGGATVETTIGLALTFDLATSGEIELLCGSTSVDHVDYSAAEFPAGAATVSIQTDPSVLRDSDPAASNDAGGRWCATPDTETFGSAGRVGTPGAASAMCPRTCSQVADHLVINEINYDDNMGDAHEFIELYNPTSDPIDMAGLTLVLFDGRDNDEYRRGALTGTIAAGEFAIVTSGSSDIVSTDGLTVPMAIQNGAPDGVGILAADNTLVDFVSYEGVFGSADLLTDGGGPGVLATIPAGLNVSIGVDPAASQTDSLARVIDGCDSGDPRADWLVAAQMTPRTTNTP